MFSSFAHTGQGNVVGEYERDICPSVSTGRLYILLACLASCFIMVALRLLDITFTTLDEIPRIVSSNTGAYKTKRANIVDRNGTVIAVNIPTASVYAHPKQIMDPEDAARSISMILGLEDYRPLLAKLKSGRSFVWIKRHIMPDEQQKIHNLGLPGIYFARDERRFCPHGALFSHVLGHVDVDGNGVSGVELKQNDELSTHDVQLTLDARVQYVAKVSLQKAVAMHQARGGAVIVLDAKNGDIISLVSYPDFNPHDISSAKIDELFNQATLSVGEQGSVFKAFTFAMAFDLGKLRVSDVFNVSAPLRLGRFMVHDYRGKGGYLSAPEVLIYSSNIGVGQVAQRIGVKYQKEYLRNAGILDVQNIGLPEVGKPLYPSDARWNDISLVTISYGHGIAVTPLHVAQMFATVVNGGVLYQPSVIMGHPVHGKRIFKESTSYIMRKLLRLVCTSGYGRKAEVDGYLILGKTGTAEKITSKGGYSKSKNVTSFVAAFPANDPEYVVLAIVDEPKPNKINMGFPTGGMVAAPLCGEIIKKIGPILGVKYQDENDAAIREALALRYEPQYKGHN